MMQTLRMDFDPRARNFTAPPSFMARAFGWLVSQTYVMGVDLSHWNSTVDFVKMKASGYEFAIVKATEGVDYTDDTFAPRWRAALDAGLIVGPYHFFRSDHSGVEQASYHLKVIQPLLDATGGHIIPPANDVETIDGVSVSVRQPRVREWNASVGLALHVTPLCYSSPYMWSTLTGNMSLDCVGWTAHWTSYAVPTWPTGWPADKRKFWQVGVYPQHPWVPAVPGVTGGVDVNRFFGSLADLRAFVGITELPDAEKLARLWAIHPEVH